MKTLSLLLVLVGGLTVADTSQAQQGWEAHRAPYWEQGLSGATAMEVHGRLFYLQQHASSLLLRDFLSEDAPDWVKQAHPQPLPTGLLLSGQTESMRWLLKVTALSGGTQWTWAAQPLRKSAPAVYTPDWMPRGGLRMFSSQEQYGRLRVIQQSYRYSQSLAVLQQVLRARLRAAAWQLEQSSSQYERWVKQGLELDVFYHWVFQKSALYLVLREAGIGSE